MNKLKELFTYRKDLRKLREHWNVFMTMFVALLILPFLPISAEICTFLVGIAYVLAFIYGWVYIFKLGGEASKRSRRPIVWFGLMFLIPFWIPISYPIFAHVTKNDVVKGEEGS